MSGNFLLYLFAQLQISQSIFGGFMTIFYRQLSLLLWDIIWVANLEIGKGHKGKFLYLWAVFVTSYFLLSPFCTTANISQWFGEFMTAYFSTVPLSILLNWLALIFNVGHLEIGERHESEVVISLSGLCDWLFFSHLCFSQCVFDFSTKFQLIF